MKPYEHDPTTGLLRLAPLSFPLAHTLGSEAMIRCTMWCTHIRTYYRVKTRQYCRWRKKICVGQQRRNDDNNNNNCGAYIIIIIIAVARRRIGRVARVLFARAPCFRARGGNVGGRRAQTCTRRARSVRVPPAGRPETVRSRPAVRQSRLPSGAIFTGPRALSSEPSSSSCATAALCRIRMIPRDVVRR